MATEFKGKDTGEAARAVAVELAVAKPETAKPSAVARYATGESLAAKPVITELPVMGPSEKVAALNGSDYLDEDRAGITDKYDEAYYLERHRFIVSPEEYDRIVAICLEPPMPPTEAMLDLAKAARKWGLI